MHNVSFTYETVLFYVSLLCVCCVSVKPSTDSITVSWTPPSNPNVIVRGYTIGWGKGIPDSYFKMLDGKQRIYIIESLGQSLS